MNDMTGGSAGREIWIDNARAMAIVGVVAVHASAGRMFLAAFGQVDWWWAAIYDTGFHWAAPLFMILSGYTLLNSSNVGQPVVFWRKRIAKIAIPMLFWQCVYHAMTMIGGLRKHHPLDPVAEVHAFLTGERYIHIWFLYALIGAYFCAPALHLVMKTLDRATAWAVTALLFGLIAVGWMFGFFFVKPQNPLLLTLFPIYIPWFWMGGVQRFHPVTIPWGLKLAIGTWIVSLFGLYVIGMSLGMDLAGELLEYNSPLMIVLTLSVFYTFQAIRVPVFGKMTQFLSRNTLGIYFLHGFAMKILDAVLPLPGASSFAGVPIMLVCAVTLTAFLVWVGRQVPGLRSLL